MIYRDSSGGKGFFRRGVFIELQEATGRSMKFISTLWLSRVINSIARFPEETELYQESHIRSSTSSGYRISILDFDSHDSRESKQTAKCKTNEISRMKMRARLELFQSEWMATSNLREKFVPRSFNKGDASPRAFFDAGQPNQTSGKSALLFVQERLPQFALVLRERRVNEEKWSEISDSFHNRYS